MTVDPAGSGAPISDRMQSLLSRAVEDQLVEQRQVAGALNELRGQLGQVAADVAGLRAATTDGGSGGGAVEGAVAAVAADVREAVRLLGERLDGVARLVQQRGADLAELNAGMSALQGAVRTQGEGLAGLGNGLGVVPALGDHIDALQQRVDSVDTGLRELRSAFAAIGARMAELPGRADLEAASSQSTAPSEQMAERLGRLEQAVAGVAATLGQPRPATSPDPAVADVAGRVERLAADQAKASAGTGERLAALERGLAEVLAAVSVDDEDVSAADAGMDDEVEGKVAAAVEQAVAASEQRLSAHFDEAMLALAEALLRRRTARAGVPAPAAVAVAEPPVVVAADEPAGDDAEDGNDDVDGGNDDDDAGDPPPWQTPTGSSPAAAPEAAHPDGSARRRPWWRPGE